ncbi:thioredoxin domain-containing protein [Thioalkalivibrio thiocyanodenitrificans]|uniref:hypothetical protein n=1 Tax=Thioalkalivibrio thiocyanodenitrificans TaxID=243063 RepID=UPI00037135D1|nr:hypothetical protein [Thioalkalivibrio thiocyanodenitrificans]
MNSIFLVEVANFSCPYCRAMSRWHDHLETAVRQYGGAFRFAPISLSEHNDTRELIYYGARQLGAEAAERVKEALYRGAQDDQLPMETEAQVLEFLGRAPSTRTFNLAQLQVAARSEEAREAHQRALRLAHMARVNLLPSYVFIQDGRPVYTLERHDDQPVGSAFRGRIEAKLKELGENQ